MDSHAFWPFPFISALIFWVHVDLWLGLEVPKTSSLRRSAFDQLLVGMATGLDQSYIVGFGSASKSGRWRHMSLSAFAAFRHLAQFAGSSYVGARRTWCLSRCRLA